MTLKRIGDELTFCMYGHSLYKHTGKVWHSPPFYYGNGYKFCLGVYANGKGAGAGTHVSIELVEMKWEYNDKLSWDRILGIHVQRISIQTMAQSKKAQAPEKEISLNCHFCTGCFTWQPPPEDLHVFKNCYGDAVSEDKFIDH